MNKEGKMFGEWIQWFQWFIYWRNEKAKEF